MSRFDEYTTKEFYERHGDPRRKHRMGNPRKWNIELDYEIMAKIFNTSPRIIKRRIYRGLLDPTDIFDILDKYSNPWKLDRRRKHVETLSSVPERE